MALTFSLQVRDEDDVVRASQMVREGARAAGLSPPDERRLDLIVRELTWNLVQHAGGGRLEIQELEQGERHGVAVECQDTGPGIGSMSTGKGEGLGLGVHAVQRQSSEFTMVTRVGQGTVIRAVMWWH